MATEQEITLGALKKAIQMETDGKEFYIKASEASRNELGKKLLRTLADEEDIHRRVFEDIYKAIEAVKGWPEKKFESDGGKGLRTVFARAIESMEKDTSTIAEEIEAVQTAMTMENKTFDFYREQEKKATFDAEKQFYNGLAVQEEEHHRVLLDYYEFLKDPAAWFVEKEHPSIDGG